MERSDGESASDSAGYLKIVVDNVERLFIESVLKIQSESEEENALGQVVLLTDITEFADKDSAKTTLIGTLSHELKTPVAAIDMCVDLVSNPRVGALNDEQKEYIETIRGNTLRICRLITDMIDPVKVESGAVDMRIQAVQPTPLVEKGIEGVRIFPDEKMIATRIDVSPDIPPVAADVDKAL